jgi:hypothetical protein
MVDQVFENPYDVDIHGTYIFPAPEQASIHDFMIHVNDKLLKPVILEKEAARAQYESWVRTHKDPALLEFIGPSNQ